MEGNRPGYTDRAHPGGTPIDVNGALQPYLGAILVALAVAVVLLIAAVLYLAARLGSIRRRLEGLTRGADGRSLEAVLDAHLDRVFAVSRDLERLAERTVALEAEAPHAFRRIGLVRFNPFEDTGGNQSFALALLDANGDGFVISSLHARVGTRIYAKALSGGRAETQLSQEEAEALRLALGRPGDRTRPAA
ncbi:MAG TPA: DUF4446 family protein [Candidatus Limnocylindrales bacterium]